MSDDGGSDPQERYFRPRLGAPDGSDVPSPAEPGDDSDRSGAGSGSGSGSGGTGSGSGSGGSGSGSGGSKQCFGWFCW